MQSKGYGTMKVANGGTTSTSIDMRGKTMLAIQLPTLDSATVSVQVSHDNSTWVLMKDETLASVGVWSATTGGIALDGDVLARFVGHNYIRLLLGAAQTAERTITYMVC